MPAEAPGNFSCINSDGQTPGTLASFPETNVNYTINYCMQTCGNIHKLPPAGFPEIIFLKTFEPRSRVTGGVCCPPGIQQSNGNCCSIKEGNHTHLQILEFPAMFHL